jgi:hypothetical protein
MVMVQESAHPIAVTRTAFDQSVISTLTGLSLTDGMKELRCCQAPAGIQTGGHPDVTAELRH